MSIKALQVFVVAYPVAVGLFALFAFILLVGYLARATRRERVNAAYLCVLVIGFLWSSYDSESQYLYFFAFSLGMLAAAAEIIQKFRGEPLDAVGTWEAFSYHIFNGLLSVMALFILIAFKGGVPADSLSKISYVVTAGLGSILIMRSKLFSVKVGDDEIAVGPEQIITVFLRFMENAIDRVRATSRIEFVRSTMDDLDFDTISDYTVTMLDAMQADEKARERLGKSIFEIGEKEIDPQLKSYRLGFCLLNDMGEGFVEQLFADKKPEWRLSAPRPGIGGLMGWMRGARPRVKSINYFAYDSNMSVKVLASRLGWTDEDLLRKVLEDSQIGTSHGYRLAFNASTRSGATTAGLTNLEFATDRTIEGRLYTLPESVLVFLDKELPDYKRVEVEVKTREDKNVKAQCYVMRAPGAKRIPEEDDLKRLIEIGEKAGLSEEYLKELALDHQAETQT